jgi:tRNA G18 (ribose-2'-O)-methylase SpoU
MLRTADAIRAEHVYLVGYTPDGDHRGVHKAALGAQDTVPWTKVPDSAVLLKNLRKEGRTLAAVEITDSSTSTSGLSLAHFPLALVVGNEVHGVSDEALGLCDLAIEIPQYGAKHSLNVSVALGIVGYEVVRRWHELNSTA